jgi:Na+-driven multidrug efflux pump
VAISGTFALATSLAARSDLAHAAAHQICIQLWLASSLLADSLAVAAQTLLAQGLAANELDKVRKVILHLCTCFMNACSQDASAVVWYLILAKGQNSTAMWGYSNWQ